MIRLVFSIILAIGLTSCVNNSKEEIIDIFANKEQTLLKSVRFNQLTNDSIINPHSFLKRGNLMVFKNMGIYSLYLFDFNNDDLIPFAQRGRGPNEIVDGAQSVGWLNDSTVYCFSLQMRQIYYYLTSDLLNGNIKPYKITKYESQSLIKQLLLPDTTIIGVNFMERDGLIGICHKDNCIDFYSSYPIDKNLTPDPIIRYLAYQGNFIASPNSETFVLSSRYSAFFAIFRLINNSLEEIHYEAFWLPEYAPSINGNTLSAVPDSHKSRFGFLSSAVGDKHIYMLYSGKERLPNEKADFPSNYSNLLLVFDINGNPIKSYILDTPVSYIGVTPEENTIIGYSDFPVNGIYLFYQ